MYKPTEPIKCPKCGAIVKVTANRFPDIEWKCLMCGESGSIKQGATSGYIQKVSEPDLGVGVTTTNTDDITTIDITPAISATNTKCTICSEEFGFDGEHRICPKCREAIVKLRKTTDSTANAMPADKSTVTDPKSTACDIPAPKWIQQGWECPKCGAILAPNQRYCPFCSKKESNWITTVGTGTQPFYSERTQKDNLTPQTGQYTNPNTNNNNTAPSTIPDYRPFCSTSEYGRTNWLGTNTPTSGQYTNPNTSTTIS